MPRYLILLLLASLLAVAVPAQNLARGEVQPVVITRYLGWDGRALGMTDAGLAAGVTGRLTAGAAYRTVDGHGRTAARRYDATGWDAWAAWAALTPAAGHPGVDLCLEGTGEAVHLATADATSSFAADPTYAAGGGRLRVHQGRWAAHLGYAAARLNGEPLATVASVGGGLTLPLGHGLCLQPTLAGYAEGYQGRRLVAEVGLSLRTTPARRADLALEISAFPQGVPLAGTPLSAAAAVGAVYGDAASAQLRTHPVAYLSLRGGYRF